MKEQVCGDEEVSGAVNLWQGCSTIHPHPRHVDGIDETSRLVEVWLRIVRLANLVTGKLAAVD